MNLAVSNLAWECSDDLFIFKELNKLKINRVECVLTKINNWENLNNSLINDYKNNLNKNGIEIKSIQSIFYGLEINDLTDTLKIIKHIKKLLEYSKILGFEIMVLGSPKLRKKSLGFYEKLKFTFQEIDKLLNNTGVELSLEPNSKLYSGEYFFRIDEIIYFLKECNFKNIKTMIDTHNLILEGDDPCLLLEKYRKYINHIHISEPNLLPLSNLNFHEKFSKTLKKINFDKTITLEMLKNDNLIENLELFNSIYKN